MARKSRNSERSRLRGGASPLVEAVESRLLLAADIVVTNVNDVTDVNSPLYPGSLRAAINLANQRANDAGANDYIVFNVAGTSRTITPVAPLPTITDGVDIDALGAGDTPTVTLSGVNAGAGADGLRIDTAAPSNVIGLIINGFRGNGIRILPGTGGHGIYFSHIGASATGVAGPGNGANGVLIDGSSGNDLVENVIAFNALDGISIPSGQNNLVSGNSVFSNGDLGIDLGSDGVTPNDLGDGDAGANGLQNSPVLTSLVRAATGPAATVKGVINSTPNTNLLITFYASPTADGEGRFKMK